MTYLTVLPNEITMANSATDYDPKKLTWRSRDKNNDDLGQEGGEEKGEGEEEEKIDIYQSAKDLGIDLGVLTNGLKPFIFNTGGIEEPQPYHQDGEPYIDIGRYISYRLRKECILGDRRDLILFILRRIIPCRKSGCDKRDNNCMYMHFSDMASGFASKNDKLYIARHLGAQINGKIHNPPRGDISEGDIYQRDKGVIIELFVAIVNQDVRKLIQILSQNHFIISNVIYEICELINFPNSVKFKNQLDNYLSKYIYYQKHLINPIDYYNRRGESGVQTIRRAFSIIQKN